MASFKSMNKHGHFTIAIQYYADITFPQLVVANKAGPASRKHACKISDNLQMVYPYVALQRMAKRDELVFMWKVFGSVILADNLLQMN